MTVWSSTTHVCTLLEASPEGGLVDDSGYACCRYLLTSLLNSISNVEQAYSRVQTAARNCFEYTNTFFARFSSVITFCGYWRDLCMRCGLMITACTVVQAVVKATSQSNGRGQILTPWGSETPERISMKLGIYNHVVGMPTHANPCGAATTWLVWANTWKNTCCGFLGVPFLIF